MNTWPYDLHTERLKDRDADLADPVLVRLTNQLSVTDLVTEQFTYLLRQFPVVQQLDNAAAKQQYLIDLTAALGRVYYVRLRVFELDDRLTIAERQQKMDQLLAEYAQYIDQFKVRLQL